MANEKRPESLTATPTDQLTPKTNDEMMLAFGEIEGQLSRPASLERDLAGTEDIKPEDIILPRLSIAQGLSPEMTPGDPAYIEGLKLFNMFNNVTGEIYGQGPIKMVPVKRSVKRIEFRPRKEGGGVVDLDVPPNDPRLEWTKDENGDAVPPVATTFVEFVVVMLRPGKPPEPIVLSIKGTNKWMRRASDNFTTFIGTRNSAIYTGIYTVDTLTPARNDDGTFGVFVVKNAGFIPKDTPAGGALLAFCKEFHEQIASREVHTERDDMVEDASFNPTEYDKEGAAPGAPAPGM